MKFINKKLEKLVEKTPKKLRIIYDIIPATRPIVARVDGREEGVQEGYIRASKEYEEKMRSLCNQMESCIEDAKKNHALKDEQIKEYKEIIRELLNKLEE